MILNAASLEGLFLKLPFSQTKASHLQGQAVTLCYHTLCSWVCFFLIKLIQLAKDMLYLCCSSW